jgi:hypothetical protein
MESCQNHFWGALNTPLPPKKINFFQEQEISQEKEFVASQISNYKKMFLIVQTYLGGQSYYSPPFSPPNPVSSCQGQKSGFGGAHNPKVCFFGPQEVACREPLITPMIKT